MHLHLIIDDVLQSNTTPHGILDMVKPFCRTLHFALHRGLNRKIVAELMNPPDIMRSIWTIYKLILTRQTFNFPKQYSVRNPITRTYQDTPSRIVGVQCRDASLSLIEANPSLRDPAPWQPPPSRGH